MSIKDLTSFELGDVSTVSKNKSDEYCTDIFDILSDNGPIKFILSNKYLLTERGIYEKFIPPSKSMQKPLDVITDTCVKFGNPIKEGKTCYLDICLNLYNEQDKELYNTLSKFKDDLVDKLIKSEYYDNIDLIAYLRANKSKIGDRVKTSFLTNHTTKPNIKYIHLKIIKSTKSFDSQGNEVESDHLCYKSYQTLPVVRVDNVRIPKGVGDKNMLNIHLCIEEQFVKEYIPASFIAPKSIYLNHLSNIIN